MDNYFSVGEEVILVSTSQPHFNGNHVVEHILPSGEPDNPYKPGFTVLVCVFGYKLVGLDPSGDDSGYFAQSALRKKHKPSEDSFTNMIRKIKYKESVHG